MYTPTISLSFFSLFVYIMSRFSTLNYNSSVASLFSDKDNLYNLGVSSDTLDKLARDYYERNLKQKDPKLPRSATFDLDEVMKANDLFSESLISNTRANIGSQRKEATFGNVGAAWGTDQYKMNRMMAENGWNTSKIPSSSKIKYDKSE